MKFQEDSIKWFYVIKVLDVVGPNRPLPGTNRVKLNMTEKSALKCCRSLKPSNVENVDLNKSV